MKSTTKRTLSLSALGLIASLLWSLPTLAADGPRSPVGKLLDPAGEWNTVGMASGGGL